MPPMRSDETIPLADGGELRTVLAQPDDGAPQDRWPGVVIVHEVFGPTPEMADVADRFAAEGYVAAAPDFFGHGNRVACIARAIVDSTLGRAGPLVDDIEAARGWLAERPDVDAERLAVIGFCMGGGFALAYAARGPAGVRAASVNYGGVPGDARALEKACPIVGSYGGRDLVYSSHAKRLERHLASLGVAHDVKTYPSAGHSFMTPGEHAVGKIAFLPMRIGYEPESAADAWRRVFAFFGEHVRDGR
jgi:carboxymethylenebutenolidase